MLQQWIMILNLVKLMILYQIYYVSNALVVILLVLINKVVYSQFQL